MKKVSRRSFAALILSALMLAGLILFAFRFIKDGDDWATFRSNGHIYSDGALTIGTITDRNGVLLASTTEDGARSYAEDELVRRATLHAVGDSGGNIATGVQTLLADDLTGYSLLTGLYGNADTITLNLDSDLCATAYSALNGRRGAVGVYNYKTGKLLCMTSSLSFDPYSPPDTTDSAYEGVYINRFLSASYVPGSIFKLVTAAAAIDCIPDIHERTFYCEGSCEIGGETVTCSGIHGTVDFETALSVSCNCAFGNIAVELGADTLSKYAEKCGVTSSFDISGIPTAEGSFDVSDAADIELAWAGIGQYTNLVNPASFLTFMGSVANEGKGLTPALIGKSSGSTRMLSESTANLLKAMMRNNVISYYGESTFPGLNICAKSGTAEVGSDEADHSWFAGFLDDEEFPLAFVVVIENGGGGLSNAGAVANTVLQAAVYGD